MFNRDRYVTKSVDEHFTFWFRMLLWDVIDDAIKSGRKLDYLLVFDINVRSKSEIEITFSQEVPYHKEVHLYNNFFLLPTGKHKLFVIDSGDYCTMMFSYEY